MTRFAKAATYSLLALVALGAPKCCERLSHPEAQERARAACHAAGYHHIGQSVTIDANGCWTVAAICGRPIGGFDFEPFETIMPEMGSAGDDPDFVSDVWMYDLSDPDAMVNPALYYPGANKHVGLESQLIGADWAGIYCEVDEADVLVRFNKWGAEQARLGNAPDSASCSSEKVVFTVYLKPL